MRVLHDPAVRASIEARLDSLRPDAPRQWGKMTADQMLWHVNEFLAASLGEGSLKPRSAAPPPAMMRGEWPAGSRPVISTIT